MARSNVAAFIARIPGRQSRASNSSSSSSSNNRDANEASSASSSKTRRNEPTSQKHFRSQSSTLSDEPSSVSSSVTDSPGSFARVYVDDSELLARAHHVASKIDFDALTNVSLSKWAWKEDRKEFTLFEAAGGSAADDAEVLAAGDINCSIEEVAALLRSQDEVDVNATMKALYKKEFIYGSLVHTISSLSLPRETEEQQQQQLPEKCVAVKTNTFVRSNVFARNEEWCFLESFERSPTGDSLVISQSSMPACELKTGKASQTRVDQLSAITTAFLVERIPRTRSVRLVFHGKLDGSGDAATRARCTAKGVVSSKTAATRLQMLARGATRIPEIVRRRRLGCQKLADKAALAAAKNSRCICCTKSLHVPFLLKKRQRCHLCAYNVCDKCCSQEQMETLNGHTTRILMCTRCMECVDSCEYADIISMPPRRRVIRVELDMVESPSKTKRGDALVSIVASALDAPEEIEQEAAMALIKHIVSEPEFVDATTRAEPAAGSGDAATTRRDLRSKTDHLNALKHKLENDAACPPPLDDCVLANADTRSYHIHVPESPATIVPDYPMPENEAQRLAAIHENNFEGLGEVLELNIICSLATEALGCFISMVTVIDKENEFILSCNVPYLHRTHMARNQTFCSHLIMDNKPLLIRNPEADVRFFNMDAVKQSGIRFYCGFPITAQDGTIVGSICSLDTEQRELTQSQYAMMTTLARTASKVIQTRATAMKAGAASAGGGGNGVSS